VGVREHIYHELLGVVRHELEHLSGAGPLAMMGPDQRKLYGERLPQSGKILHDLNRRRRLFGHSAHPHELWGIEELERSDAASGGDTLSYMTSYDELGPFSVGFYTQARSARIPYEQVVKQYIDYFHESGQLSDAGAAQALEWFMTWGNDKFPKIR